MDSMHAEFVLGVCLGETQVMIPKVERDGVCICMVYPTLWPGGTAECVYRSYGSQYVVNRPTAVL